MAAPCLKKLSAASSRRPTATFFLSCFLYIILCILGAGCETQATPLPAVLPPTPTEAPLPTLPPPIRYAFTANTAGYVQELDVIRQTGLVEQLTDNNIEAEIIAGYDVVVTYGTVDQPGWARSPVTPHVALLMNSSLPPLHEPEIQTLIQRAMNPQAVVETLAIAGAAADPANPADSLTLRNALANAGYPDGLDLVLAFGTFPGVGLLADQLATAGFRITPLAVTPETAAEIFEARRAHLLLVIWTTPAERAAWAALAGDDFMMDLYAFPISYRAASGLTLTYTPGGFPIATR